jgi:hypothetical protein
MNTLVETAFGADPGRWPLPSAKTAEERWLRAVALGGQGRYATATAELEALARLQDRGPFPARALSTRASFLRQLGWHSHARTWDGRALALAGMDADARADALIGLAADALGVGRFPLSARLLARAREVVDAGASARLPVRLAWVSAELAMATGDGAAAVGHAERAVDLARPVPTRRGYRPRRCRGVWPGPADLGLGVPARRRRKWVARAVPDRCRARRLCCRCA